MVAGIVCVTSLSTLNATILTGARSIFALGRSFTPLAVLGRPGVGGRSPHNAILVQSAVTIGLLVFGAFSRDGFELMVEYTAPVFWTFMLLVGVSLFVLRWRDPKRAIPFPVPLYPVAPVLFCGTAAYLLYSSLLYAGAGALLSVGIFLAGILPPWPARDRKKWGNTLWSTGTMIRALFTVLALLGLTCPLPPLRAQADAPLLRRPPPHSSLQLQPWLDGQWRAPLHCLRRLARR